MNFQIVKTIYRKEMLDMLRDRRALISMIVVPIIAIPGLFSILHYFTENLGKKAEKESVRIGVSANVSKASIRDALTKADSNWCPRVTAGVRLRRKPWPHHSIKSANRAARTRS